MIDRLTSTLALLLILGGVALPVLIVLAITVRALIAAGWAF